eukprot:gb/GECG01013908.1/.p1 GENE.gb/GECG01013908.1/~~gb/GECG01013908.1/.p1  ORF type:complete len:120 (+),score=7.22 gb/GECG01013908.1/:1-360(+)
MSCWKGRRPTVTMRLHFSGCISNSATKCLPMAPVLPVTRALNARLLSVAAADEETAAIMMLPDLYSTCQASEIPCIYSGNKQTMEDIEVAKQPVSAQVEVGLWEGLLLCYFVYHLEPLQ